MTKSKIGLKAFCKLQRHEPQGEKPYFTWVVPQCPICGKKHIHGAGDDEAKVEELLGHRNAECSGTKGFETAPNGYFLVRDFPLRETMLETIEAARATIQEGGYLTAEVQGGCDDPKCPAMEVEITINEVDGKVEKAPKCPFCRKPLKIHWLKF